MKLPKKVPAEFKCYFWDVDFESLNPTKKSIFVINRLLDKGDVKATKWIRQNFPEELIEKSLTQLRDFSPKSATFWATVYKIPLEKVKCLQEPYLSTQRKLWPF